MLGLLSELIDEGIRVFIVTNADEKWVNNCLKHFLPDLKDFLSENAIRIYSAKNLFSKSLTVEKWKVLFC
jgi:hypothetical protein